MAVAPAEHALTNEQVVFAFGPDMTPVLEVDPGAVVSLEMKDALANQITREGQLIRDITRDIDLDRVNGATGPVAVRGAEPGDSLIVDILEIRPAATGVALTIPGIGQLQAQMPEPVTRIFRVEGDMIHMNDRVSFPARPMLGVVGVATGGGDPVPCGLAGQHGGNLDDHLTGVGSRLYMPVRQVGGLFAAGDMHAAMGDGEICVTGVEVAGEATVRFDLLKGASGTWPVTGSTSPGSSTPPPARTSARRSGSPARKPPGSSSISGASRSRTRSCSCPSPATSGSASPASPPRSRRSPASRSRRSQPVRRRSAPPPDEGYAVVGGLPSSGRPRVNRG